MNASVQKSFCLRRRNEPPRKEYHLILWLVLLIMGGGSSIVAQTTISDDAARAAYAEYRILFEEKKFPQCYSACQALTNKMGRKTRKVQWLLVESGYNAFSYAIDRSANKQMDSAYTSLLSYKNLSVLHAEIRQLEAMMDSSENSYSYVREIGSKVMDEVNKYAYQKDRTPEKAIAFLNDCAKKFQKKVEYRGGEFDIKFKLDSGVLIVKAAATTFGKYYKKPYYKGELKIHLKNVWIDRRYIYRMKSEMGLVYIFAMPQSASRSSSIQADTLPVITDGSNSSTAMNKIVQRRSNGKTEKSAMKDLENNAFTRISEPYVISLFHFFNESIPNFKEENYDQKIEETFRYLIDYFKK